MNEEYMHISQRQDEEGADSPGTRRHWEQPPEPPRKTEQARQRLKGYAKDKAPNRLKNPTDLQVRFWTGLVYIVISIICILINDITLVILLSITAGIAAGEFYYMLRSDAKLPNELLGIIGAVLYPPSVWFAGMTGALVVSIGLLVALLVWFVFWMKARVADVGVSFFGAAYTGLMLSGLILIRMSLSDFWGGILVLGIYLSVWANDVFAYMIGRQFGKHKLAPRTSPKKSWEGFFAGLVGSIIVWLLMTLIPGVSMDLVQAGCFGLICGMMGVLGDLAESRIKRNAGFKDSGTIMPGHGGLLDRTDSLFLVAVISAILLIGGGCIPFVG